jgi:hypothetical protein
MCLTFNVNAISTSNEDMYKEIDSIFNNRISNSYELEYSNEVNINDVNSYFKSKYMLDSSITNIYTYEDFINYDKLKRYPIVDNNKYIFSVKFNLRNENEYNKVIEFGNKLKDKYNYLSDDEKLYLVINYIQNNITKSDSTSLYDAIYNNNINESYVLTQFMLSNLNIESYITERLNTGKKYNLVRLNNKWYILDIDEGYILVGYNTADFKPDTYSNNIIVSKYNYILESYDLDYNDIKKLIIKEDKKEETKKEVQDNDTNEYTGLNIKDFNTLIEWILLIVSLCVIILVVKHYTR